MPSLGLRRSKYRHTPITPYAHPSHLSITIGYQHRASTFLTYCIFFPYAAFTSGE